MEVKYINGTDSKNTYLMVEEGEGFRTGVKAEIIKIDKVDAKTAQKWITKDKKKIPSTFKGFVASIEVRIRIEADTPILLLGKLLNTGMIVKSMKHASYGALSQVLVQNMEDLRTTVDSNLLRWLVGVFVVSKALGTPPTDIEGLAKELAKGPYKTIKTFEDQLLESSGYTFSPQKP